MGWAKVVEGFCGSRADPDAARSKVGATASKHGPLEFRPDKPSDADDPKRPPLAAAREVRFDSLTHDAAYFEAIERASIHGGLLDGLRPTTTG